MQIHFRKIFPCNYVAEVHILKRKDSLEYKKANIMD